LLFLIAIAILANVGYMIKEIHMAATPEQELDWEHEAIRKQIEFLTESLSNVSEQSCKGAAQQIPLKEQITLYRWSLYDFRETLKRHIELDERLFDKRFSATLIKQLLTEHETLKTQVDEAISLAEDATYNNLSQDELTQCALKIRQAVDRMFSLIESHTATEEKFWK